MTPFAAAQITKDRLRLWQRRMEREQLSATPAVLISVQHDQARRGELVISTTEDIPDAEVLKILRAATEILEKQIRRRS